MIKLEIISSRTCCAFLLLLLSSSISQCRSFQLNRTPLLHPTQQHRLPRRRRPHEYNNNNGNNLSPISPAQPQSSPYSTSSTDTSLSLGLSSIAAPLGSLTVLATVILIHESGHFLAARSMGIKVKQFSVGVGPRIAGFTRTPAGDEETGIEFNLRAIPLGGYVEFPENYNTTLQFQRETDGDRKRARIKMLVKEDGETVGAAARRVIDEAGGMAGEGDRRPWWRFDRNKKGKQDLGTGGVLIGEDGTVTVSPVEYYDDPDLLQNRPWGERAIVLSAGVVFNLILSFTCFFGLLTVGGGLPKAVFNEGAVIGSVTSGAASVGLLNKGDVILALNGESLYSTTSPTAFASQEGITKFVSEIRQTKSGESLTLSVIKPNSATPTSVTIKPKPLTEAPDAPSSIGVTLAPNFSRVDNVRATSLPDAILKSTSELTDLSTEITRATLQSIGSLLSSTSSSQSLSGPIGVIKSGADVVSRNDYRAVIGFVAVLSVNLAVINSLPFPALDGGQLVFVLVEAVTGKKVDQRLQEGVNAAALLFLLSLSVTATAGDLGFGGGR